MENHDALRAVRRSDSLRVCLAASGGGHVRQLLDLEAAWSNHSYFFVTEDTALGRSLSDQHPTTFLPHAAVGQIRLQSPWKFATSIVRNFVASLNIVLKYKPDVIISTGAGAVFFTVVIARLLGAKVFAIESFARFDGPSLFFRAASPFANVKIVQSQKLARQFPDALVFDPLRITDHSPPPKKQLLFATVGATLPFDRLTKAVAATRAAGGLKEEVILQVGDGGHKPDGIDAFESLPFTTIKGILADASIVVCHGGTGSIITALQNGCRVVAMARQADRGEHYDDHQSEITETFRARGLIDVATTQEDLVAALERARARPGLVATTDHTALSGFLNSRLSEIKDARSHANAPT